MGGGLTGGAPGAINGHTQSSYHQSFLMSSPAGGGRNGNDKASPSASQNQDSTKFLGRVPDDPHQLSLQDPKQNPPVFPRASDMAQVWDPSTELSLRTSILKGSTFLPYAYSGTKFEQMLQQMLHREVTKDGEMDGGVEEQRMVHNGGEPESKMSPDTKRESVRSGDEDRGVLGVTCHWCSQLFPNVAVLLQHERYHCKMNREAVEVPESLRGSSPYFFPGSALQTENSKSSEIPNGLSGNKSPVQKPSWQSVPQQLLVAMNSSPQPRHDARAFWPSQEKVSPTQTANGSPELSSPRARKRTSSSRFSSPVCLDLSSCPPELSSPQTQSGSPWSAQEEPLDLSLPKQLSDHEGSNKPVNGSAGKRERREFRTQQLRSPTSHLPLHHHPFYSRVRAPVFPGSLFNGFPMFSQSGLGLPGPDSMAPVSFSQSTNPPGFLSPMAYMMDADAEATLKKIHQERQTLMVSHT